MAVQVFIRRKIKRGRTKEVFAILNRFRSDAMKQKGYISGVTMINYDDPHEMVVISTWQTIQNWIDWKENKERKANEKLLEKWLEAPTTYSTYIFGTTAIFKK